MLSLILTYLGIIISLSILLAAGLAVYENPQVRQWVDESRRKIAVALHSLGDDINPGQPSSPDPDASTHEDSSPDASERRRRARQEILERGRMMEERRRKAKEGQQKAKSQSFDDMVDQEGRLRKDQEVEGVTKTTATDSAAGDANLRRRKADDGAALGSRLANPFEDEIALMDLRSHTPEEAPPVPPRPSSQSQTPPPVPPKIPHDEGFRPMPPPISIPVNPVPAHSSGPLVDLTPNEITPTTSTFSISHADLLSLDQVGPNSHSSTPSFIESPSHLRSSTPSIIASPPALPNPQQQSYFSVNEWAENASSSFYTPPRAQTPTLAQTPPIVLPEAEMPSAPNVTHESGGEAPRADESHTMSEDDTRYGFESDSEMDIISQISEDGQMTPVSWTEVGSTFSDDER